MRAQILTLMIVICVVAGCGRKGVTRLDVHGTVKWKGQSVPLGIIYFDPDVVKGNRGPQGFMMIKDGKFDSNAELSKGCVAGPHVVKVSAYTGQNINKLNPYGDAMFAVQPTIEIEVPAKGGEVNITIPENTPAAKDGSKRLEQL